MFDQEFNFLKSQSKGQTDKEIKDYTNRRVRLGIIISSISEDNKISIEDSTLPRQLLMKPVNILKRERCSRFL